jgi:hypothetical protein
MIFIDPEKTYDKVLLNVILNKWQRYMTLQLI